MTDSFDGLFFLIAVLFAFLLIGYQYRTSDTDEFHTVRRQAGFIRSTASLFTIVGAPHFVIFTTLSYLYGWWPVAFYIGTLSGFIILSILTNPIRSSGASDVHTYADIAVPDLGRLISSLFSVLSVLFTVGVVVAQIIVSATVIERLTGINYEICVLLFSGTVIGYLLFGGYRSLLYTDIIQAIMMFLFTALLAYLLWIFNISSSVNSATVPSKASDFTSILADPFIPLLFLGGMLAVTGAPEVWQRILSARSNLVARGSLLISACIMLAWGFFVVAVGNYISTALPDSIPNAAFVDFIMTQMPPWLIGGVVMLLLAAMISTADTELFASSVIIHKEKLRYSTSDVSQIMSVKTTQIIIVVVGLFAASGSIFLSGLIDAWGVLLNLTYILAPLAIALVLKRGGSSQKFRRGAFIFSFLASFLTFIFIWIWKNDFFSYWALLIIFLASIPLFFPGERSSLTKEAG